MKVNNAIRGRNGRLFFSLGAIATLAILTAGIFHHQQSKAHHRQAEVAKKGAQVMPFDLEKTTHRFEPKANGGLQTVVADNPTDRSQIALIQSHLQTEATKFEAGDFSDPAAIHGHTMPGLAGLESNYQSIDIQYAALADGGQIRYVTDNADSVSALHAWFNAQRRDHGHHAE